MPSRRAHASVAVMMLRQTALRAAVLPRTALSRLAARPLCMHDDFKPQIKSYAGTDGDVHAQVRRPPPVSQVACAGEAAPCARTDRQGRGGEQSGGLHEGRARQAAVRLQQHGHAGMHE